MKNYIRYVIVIFLAFSCGSKATPYEDFQAYMEESQAFVRAIRTGFERWVDHEALTERAASLKRALTLDAWAEGFLKSYDLPHLDDLTTNTTSFGSNLRGLYRQVMSIFDHYSHLMELVGKNHEDAEIYFSTHTPKTPTQMGIADAFKAMMKGHSTYQTLLKELMHTHSEGTI